SDLFNLRPCDVDTNSERGSRYYDDVPGGSTFSGADGVTFSGDRWEPQDSEKGDLARGCFYMAVRYDGSDSDTLDLELSDDPSRDGSRFGLLSRLLEWHRSDPVDDVELLRNDTIADQYQRNRNPFIDRPEFAELLYLPRFPGRDADEDGLLDLWEWQKLGTDSEAGNGDADNDGVVNLLEFAFGMDPRVGDPEKLPRLENGVLTFRQASEASALDFIPEVSSSLEPGSWDAHPLGRVGLDSDGVRTMSIPIGELVGRRYFRVRVSN
ncbi:endonuclease, partial [Verrucomicrobiales bacterium]|nr:endonuclease [Verrucomicrobiales bacterium]